MGPDVLLQVGAGPERRGAVRAGVRLLPAVGAGVLREPRRHAEALPADPAAEGAQAAVDALVVLQVGQLPEAFATSGALKRPLVCVCPHVNLESGVVSKLLVADRTAEACPAFGLVECSLEMRQNVLLQRTVRDEAPATRPHGAFEGRLTSVGQTVQVQALLRHAAMPAEVALNLPSGPPSALASPAAMAPLVLGGRTALQVNLQHRLVYELGRTVGTCGWHLILMSERVQIQLLSALEGFSAFRTRERMAGVEQLVIAELFFRAEH